VARHNDLMALIQGSSWATDDVLARLRSLEAEGPAAGPPLWESVVMSSGAADDERVIEASRRVWEALGPNARTPCSSSLARRPGEGFSRAAVGWWLAWLASW
jgi:hypothetical protein